MIGMRRLVDNAARQGGEIFPMKSFGDAFNPVECHQMLA